MKLKILNFIVFLIASAIGSAYENEYGPGYGTQWLLFIDDNGTTHKMNFSTLPMERRGFIFGKAYCYLYTRENADEGELLVPPDDGSDIKSKFFNGTRDTKAITHGWLSKENTDWIQNMKRIFLNTYDVNVLTVDWSELADNPVYPWSAFSTKYVGKYLAKVIRSLRQNYNGKHCSVHLIGHSLGAQVMGYAGMYSGGRIDRITGLDPARPLFEIPLMDKNYRLDPSDAEFVDIIHTCGGVYGYKNSHGHADFYPNSGKPAQPGCEGAQQRIEACSHGRAYEFFSESIDSATGFISYPCENWKDFERGECRSNPALMGDPAASDHRGDFYLQTSDKSKYALGSES